MWLTVWGSAGLSAEKLRQLVTGASSAARKQAEMNAGAQPTLSHSVWNLGPHSWWSSSSAKPLRESASHPPPEVCL